MHYKKLPIYLNSYIELVNKRHAFKKMYFLVDFKCNTNLKKMHCLKLQSYIVIDIWFYNLSDCYWPVLYSFHLNILKIKFSITIPKYTSYVELFDIFSLIFFSYILYLLLWVFVAIWHNLSVFHSTIWSYFLPLLLRNVKILVFVGSTTVTNITTHLQI